MMSGQNTDCRRNMNQILRIENVPLDLALGNIYAITIDGKASSGKILALEETTGDTPADKEHPSILIRFRVMDGPFLNQTIKAQCVTTSNTRSGVGLANGIPSDPDRCRLRLKLFEMLANTPQPQSAHT